MLPKGRSGVLMEISKSPKGEHSSLIDELKMALSAPEGSFSLL